LRKYPELYSSYEVLNFLFINGEIFYFFLLTTLRTKWRPAPAHLGDGNLVPHVPADSGMTGLQSLQTLQTADGQVAMNDGYSFVTELLCKNITAITLELQISYERESAPIMHFLTALRVGPHFYHFPYFEKNEKMKVSFSYRHAVCGSVCL
jgi:hypothetical protein